MELENYTLSSASVCTEEFYGPKRDELYIVIPITIIYIVIFITGTIGNITTCLVIYGNRSLHTATNYYLFSLAISDLVLLVSGLPQEIYLIWNRYPYVFGSTFCFLRGLLAEMSGNATVLTITGFTVERYLAICHPFLSHTMSKLSRAIKFIVCIWVLAICLAIPQALPLKVLGTCAQCTIINPLIDHIFEISTFVFFATPMTLITLLYIRIGSTLRSSNMIKSRNEDRRVHSKSSKKVIKMLVAVVVAFFICWAPFHLQRLYSIYATFPQPDEETHSLYLNIYAIVTYISGILYYVSTTINPILYNIMSAKFRDAFKETFSKCCCVSSTNPSETNYSILLRKRTDSTDAAPDDTMQTNTTFTHKNSTDSFGIALRYLDHNGDQRKSRIYTSVPTEQRIGKITRYFGWFNRKSHHENIKNEQKIAEASPI